MSARASTSTAGSAPYGVDHVPDVGRRPFGEGPPASVGDGGDLVGPPPLGLEGEHARAEERPADGGREQTGGVGPAPQVRRQLGHVVDERRVLPGGHGIVALGHEVRADVADEQGRTPAVAAEAGAAPTTVWSMVEGKASSSPDAHIVTGRQPRSPSERAIQSSSTCMTFTTCGSPSITTRSNDEPDFASALRKARRSSAPSSSSSTEPATRRGVGTGRSPPTRAVPGA